MRRCPVSKGCPETGIGVDNRYPSPNLRFRRRRSAMLAITDRRAAAVVVSGRSTGLQRGSAARWCRSRLRRRQRAGTCTRSRAGFSRAGSAVSPSSQASPASPSSIRLGCIPCLSPPMCGNVGRHSRPWRRRTPPSLPGSTCRPMPLLTSTGGSVRSIPREIFTGTCVKAQRVF